MQLALSSRQADAPQQLCVPRIKEIFMGKFLRFSSNSIFGIENHVNFHIHLYKYLFCPSASKLSAAAHWKRTNINCVR